jgi:hypothetical protein
MATVTLTDGRPKRIPKGVKLAPENERYMRACADIASVLIQDHEAQAAGKAPKKDINLNSLRTQISKKHYLTMFPSLTAIIAAVPEHSKKYILPKLIAKPIRMVDSASCVRGLIRSRNFVGDCRRGRHVQAAPVSAHLFHRKYLRLLPRRPGLRLRVLDAVVHRIRADVDAGHQSPL